MFGGKYSQAYIDTITTRLFLLNDNYRRDVEFIKKDGCWQVLFRRYEKIEDFVEHNKPRYESYVLSTGYVYRVEGGLKND